MAAEIGENEMLTDVLVYYDIGKAADHEMEGSHVDIGLELATDIVNQRRSRCHRSHHGDHEAETVIAVLVSAADTMSAARPGARSESLENYLKRLQQLESLTNEFEGVEKSYAIQAGREVRILVKPDVVNDAETFKLARDIKKKIENTMSYPGTIKVTVIRETRVQEVAK